MDESDFGQYEDQEEGITRIIEAANESDEYSSDGEVSAQSELVAVSAALELSTDDGNTEEDENVEEDLPLLPFASVVEAILFAAREPLKPAQIARAVGKGTRQDAVLAAIDELNVHYLESGRAFEIAEISRRFQLMSRPEFVEYIKRIYPKRDLGEKEKTARLSPSALDTLAIIAYKQPVTRGEIEHIRGVGCGPVLRALMERGSVKVVGKAQVVGQPWLYGTTESFLAEFGLGSIEELPLRSEFLSLVGAVTEAVDEIGFELEDNGDSENTADSEDESLEEANAEEESQPSEEWEETSEGDGSAEEASSAGEEQDSFSEPASDESGEEAAGEEEDRDSFSEPEKDESGEEEEQEPSSESEDGEFEQEPIAEGEEPEYFLEPEGDDSESETPLNGDEPEETDTEGEFIFVQVMDSEPLEESGSDSGNAPGSPEDSEEGNGRPEREQT